LLPSRRGNRVKLRFMATGYAKNLAIRDATESDVDACIQIDVSYETDYVWQMDARDDAGAISIGFRTVRLPRLMRVVYPRDPDWLAQAIGRREVFLVAETSGVVRGYLRMRFDAGPRNAWVTDLAVGRLWRRQRIGSALLGEAYSRARHQRMQWLTVETQTKNYPGICFLQKHGLSFCGFNDRYYPNHDIALFFGQNVRV
jgi:GNAT superfamily N-acetyltransferase